MGVVKVGLGTLRRSKMHKDGPDPFRLNLAAELGHIIQGLAAERTSKVTKKNQQQRGLIDEFEQRPAALRAVRLHHGKHVGLPWACFKNRRFQYAPPKGGTSRHGGGEL